MAKALRSKTVGRLSPRYNVHASPHYHHDGVRFIKYKTHIINMKEVSISEELSYKSRDRIEVIKKLIRQGANIDPITVWNKRFPEDTYSIRNGHHRYIAFKELGIKKIPAVIYEDTRVKKEEREKRRAGIIKDKKSMWLNIRRGQFPI